MITKERFKVIQNASASSMKVYQTIIYMDGSTSCNCAGWCYKKPGRERYCKHVTAIGNPMPRVAKVTKSEQKILEMLAAETADSVVSVR